MPAPGRVAAVHRQTRRGLAVAVAFTVTAAVSAIVPHDTGWWLPLHLFLVGGLLSAMAATTQLLAVTWSAAPAPRPAVAGAQRWCLAAGALAVVAGREADVTWLTDVGGIAVAAAMLAMVPILISIRRRAFTRRFTPAIDAYVLAFVAGAAGSVAGTAAATGRAGTRWVELRAGHLTLNVFGLVGLVIAATLPYFVATQVRARMSPWATPAAMRAVAAVLAVAAAVAATGQFSDRPGVAAGGLGAYAAGILAAGALLPRPGRRQRSWAGPRLGQLIAGLAWWAAMTVALAVVTLTGDDDRPVLRALVIGGFAQILVASLAYLGPVLRGGGHRRLTAGFATTRSWPSLVLGNAAAVAALADHRPLTAVLIGLWLMDVIARGARLVVAPVLSSRAR